MLHKKTITWVLIPVAALVIGIAVLFTALDPEKLEMDNAARSRLGGSYAALSDGKTHYSLQGPDSGRVVVLVHGGTIPMFTWDEVAPMLAAKGFRVLRYDMFGRGRSDRPHVPYNRALYQRQLLGLLDSLHLGGSIDLVGYSFGGAIVAEFTAVHPERVRRLALISPVVHHYPIAAVLRPPVIGEVVLRFIGTSLLNKRANSNYSGTDMARHHAAEFTEQMRYKGFQASILSMFRSDALVDYRECFAAVGKQDRRVLLIWGMQDLEITKDRIDAVRTLIPKVEYHGFTDQGHNIVFKKPQMVADLLIDFLKRP
jgi:pimeloyl-ACP methyl ester carboxylesterase